MKKTILLTNRYQGEPEKILKNHAGRDFEIRMLPAVSREELIQQIPDADYLLVSGRLGIEREVLEHAGKLKMIQRTGVGLDNMDLQAIRDKGIPLYINRGVNANSVAEYTVMLMLAALKQVYAINRQMRSGIWKKQETGLRTNEIAGKTVGLVGLGNIGKKVARMLSGFDTQILYFDPVRLSEQEEEKLDIRYCAFDELIRCSDIISLHCPYNQETGSIINEKELAMMKDQVILVNTARGKLINGKDLEKYLASGKIRACGLDVFEEEPLGDENTLRRYDNVLLSPHVAGLSYETFDRMMKNAIDNIRAFDQGQMDLIEEKRYQW